MRATHEHCRLRGLYVITDTALIGGNRLVPAVAAALNGGARMVQYRDKSSDTMRRRDEATALLGLCRQAGVPLIINDDIELAAGIGADGVHLGHDDASPHDARQRLGSGAIIGLSCHSDPGAPYIMEADYAAFGRFFSSSTKPGAPQASLEVLGQAREKLDIPVVAIGGINAANGASLIAAGADMLAVVAGVFGSDDIESAAREISGLFERQ